MSETTLKTPLLPTPEEEDKVEDVEKQAPITPKEEKYGICMVGMILCFMVLFVTFFYLMIIFIGYLLLHYPFYYSIQGHYRFCGDYATSWGEEGKFLRNIELAEQYMGNLSYYLEATASCTTRNMIECRDHLNNLTMEYENEWKTIVIHAMGYCGEVRV